MSETSNRRSKRPRTFPKEGEAKLKDTIQKLKARNRYLEKKVRFYEDKLLSEKEPKLKAISDETGDFMQQTEKAIETREEFRQRFLKEFRDSLKARKNDKA